MAPGTGRRQRLVLRSVAADGVGSAKEHFPFSREDSNDAAGRHREEVIRPALDTPCGFPPGRGFQRGDPLPPALGAVNENDAVMFQHLTDRGTAALPAHSIRRLYFTTAPSG